MQLDIQLLVRHTVPKVAERLIDFFSLHGIPSEILTDQATKFTLVLLKELY